MLMRAAMKATHAPTALVLCWAANRRAAIQSVASNIRNPSKAAVAPTIPDS